MKTLHIDLDEAARPRYLGLAQAITRAVRSGRLRAGETLPSTRLLARETGMHRHTVMRALQQLVAEGWLEARERSSYVVRERLPTTPSPPVLRLRGGRPGSEPLRLVRGAKKPAASEHSVTRFDFRSQGSDPRLTPVQEIRRHLSRALKNADAEMLDQSYPQGHPELLANVATYLRRVRALTGKSILITSGAQEAIYLTAMALIEPDDCVAVERLGYAPAWQALRMAGARLLPIQVDEHGADPDDLERCLDTGRLRLIYLTPLHQYPTTVSLSPQRRARIYALAARHGVPILEDDYDHEFHYGCQPLAPLASHDPAGLVVYAASFSKILFPSARLGVLAGSREFIAHTAQLRKAVSGYGNPFLQLALAAWMRDGGLERHVRRLTRIYGQRRDALVNALQSEVDAGHDLAWQTPAGGLAIWLDVRRDAAALAARAAAAGITLPCESDFQLRAGPARFLRLGFANLSVAQLSAGTRAFAQLLN